MAAVATRVTPPLRRAPSRIAQTDDGYADETPIRRAQRLARSSLLHSFSKKTQEHLKRIGSAAVLPTGIVKILDDEGATQKICRWVAHGKYLQDRALRLALAMLLRRESRLTDFGPPARSGWVWPDDPLLCPAEKLFKKLPQYKRLVHAGTIIVDRRPDNMAVINMSWGPYWAALQAEVSTVDRDSFVEQVRRVVKEKKRRRMRKRIRITPEIRHFVEAIDTLKRGVLRGEITVGDVIASKENP